MLAAAPKAVGGACSSSTMKNNNCILNGNSFRYDIREVYKNDVTIRYDVTLRFSDTISKRISRACNLCQQLSKFISANTPTLSKFTRLAKTQAYPLSEDPHIVRIRNFHSGRQTASFESFGCVSILRTTNFACAKLCVAQCCQLNKNR